MQATGMVNDHLVSCFCHETCSGKRRTPRLEKDELENAALKNNGLKIK
jgi:hypothetical protein